MRCAPGVRILQRRWSNRGYSAANWKIVSHINVCTVPLNPAGAVRYDPVHCLSTAVEMRALHASSDWRVTGNTKRLQNYCLRFTGRKQTTSNHPAPVNTVFSHGWKDACRIGLCRIQQINYVENIISHYYYIFSFSQSVCEVIFFIYFRQRVQCKYHVGICRL